MTNRKMQKKKINFGKILDAISWLILAFIFVYALLKVFGIIKSIDWVLIVGASIIAGRYMQKVDWCMSYTKKIDKLIHEVSSLKEEIISIKSVK